MLLSQQTDSTNGRDVVGIIIVSRDLGAEKPDPVDGAAVARVLHRIWRGVFIGFGIGLQLYLKKKALKIYKLIKKYNKSLFFVFRTDFDLVAGDEGVLSWAGLDPRCLGAPALARGEPTQPGQVGTGEAGVNWESCSCYKV